MSCSAHSMVPVRLEVAGAIATIVLARPPVNALDVPMLQALIAALQQVDESPDIRAAILTGEGRCFSAGVDLKAQLAALEAGEAGPMDLGVALYDALLHGRKPLIAAINGHALGAGLGMAASCNILVAAEGVQFGLPEIDVGALGHSTVNRMLLTGHRLTAEELAHRGAIEACLPADQLMAYAHGIARQIASKDPTAISLARQCLAAVEVMPVLDGYAHESRLGRQLGETAEAQALMRRFLARGAG
jgi:enoyl-CoA hydratase